MWLAPPSIPLDVYQLLQAAFEKKKQAYLDQSIQLETFKTLAADQSTQLEAFKTLTAEFESVQEQLNFMKQEVQRFQSGMFLFSS